MNEQKFKYEIGQTLLDSKRNITIINRKYIKNDDEKFGYLRYQIKCNICGYSSEGYNFNDKSHRYVNEYWAIESNIAKGKGCPCCANKAIVYGINDITTTDNWMVKYFQGGYEEAKLYMSGSTHRIYPVCPDCNSIKTTSNSIRDIKRHNGIACSCQDGISYPNKFAYALFKQISNQLNIYINEYSPTWIGQRRFDNYFEINGKKYIVEMDGGLGHGKLKYGCSKDVINIESIKNDLEKDQLANAHGITVIRINSDISDGEYLKYKMCEKLHNILNLNDVNWNDIFEFSEKNLVKMVCDYYNNTHESTYYMETNLGIDRTTISKYLKRGNKIGWCNYKNHIEKKNDNVKLISEILNKNKDITVLEICKNLNHEPSVIWSWINKGEQLNIIDLSNHPNINRKTTIITDSQDSLLLCSNL